MMLLADSGVDAEERTETVTFLLGRGKAMNINFDSTHRLRCCCLLRTPDYHSDDPPWLVAQKFGTHTEDSIMTPRDGEEAWR